MSESILSLSEFKADASRLLDRIREEPTTLVLTRNGRACAVVEDYEPHRRHRQALLMLKLMMQGEGDVEDGRLVAQDQVFAEARQCLVAGEPADD